MAKKVLKVFIFLFIVAALCVASYLAFRYFVYGEVYKARPSIVKGSLLDKIRKEHDENIYKPSESASQRPYSVLLVGLDEKSLKSGRSDTLMVAIVDPKTKSVNLLSIPRDTYVKIAGKGMDKITHAHNGGINATIMTVEDFLDTKIDYYAQINFNGFQDLVDDIGGVTVDVEKTLTFKDRITGTHFTLYQGAQRLTGIQALNYARFRGDAEGDFGRNRRQQQVVKAIIDESMSFRNITKVNSLLKDLGDNVATDMDFNVLAKTLTKMKNVSSKDVYSIPLKAAPMSIDGVSYVKADDDSLKKVKSYIKDVLKGKKPKHIEE